MITKKKSEAMKFLESLRGRALSFGRMIESIRQADEVGQAELAKKLGVSRMYLCDVEKGRRPVTVERAAQFAKVLGYSVHQFVALAMEETLRKEGLKVKVHLEAA